MDKKILILGEEYWFESTRAREDYKDADFLLDELSKSKNAHRIILLKTPAKLIKKIKEIGKTNISAIFMFHDVLSDSFTNNITINNMKKFIKRLQNKYNIHIYPGINVTNTFGSKKYYKTLIDKKKLNYAALPNSLVYMCKNYNKSKDDEIVKNLYEKTQIMFQKFNKIIIKKGYSYEGKQVKIIKKNITFKEFKEIIEQLNFKKFWGNETDSRLWEKNINRYYILQGYNRIIRNSLNEFRVFFLNGKAVYIVFDDDIDNVCINDMRTQDDTISINNSQKKEDFQQTINVPLAKEIVRFAKKIFQDYKPYFWKKEEEPILFRTDISFAIADEFQDEHSIVVEGFNKPVRIYVNELEIDPTSFFYNRMICKKRKTVDNESVERTMGRLINNYIEKHNL
jgi:hypothetical protein